MAGLERFGRSAAEFHKSALLTTRAYKLIIIYVGRRAGHSVYTAPMFPQTDGRKRPHKNRTYVERLVTCVRQGNKVIKLLPRSRYNTRSRKLLVLQEIRKIYKH